MTLIIGTILMLWQAAGTTTGRPADVEMTTGGWVFMIGAWTCILTLVIYTFSKVLRGGGK
ncbi:MAG TPA: hypothetical protein VEZ40_18055 [Pyrinomonadaceae bacterium]|nr:hypothetical protein [Pyrinomonadaceae bacterium]